MTNQTTTLLKLKDIYKTYTTAGETLSVLENAQLSVNNQEKVAIIGESGCGKSTFLHIASLLDSYNSGEIFLNDVKINTLNDKKKSTIRNKNFGFIYQAHLLLSEFTVLENTLMPILIERSIKKVDKERALMLLEKLNILECLNKFPTELSGGQQQRVAIARALIQSPKIVFADEPTGNLDPSTAKIVRELLDSLIQSENISLVLVTHDLELAQTCHKIYKLEDKQLLLIK